jgi:hypothetical protein
MKKPKIFHGVYNIGTQAGVFSEHLRKLGYEALAVTKPDIYNRVTDLEFKTNKNIRCKNIFCKLYYYLIWNNAVKVWIFFKFDIFHFYFGQSLMESGFDLHFYRFFGKKVLMEYLGNDVQGYSTSIQKYKWTNVGFMMNEDEGEIYDKRIEERMQFEMRFIDRPLV